MTEKLKVFDMFSGIGGFALGLKKSNLPHEIVGFSEIDPYAQKIYKKHFIGVKNYGDATKIDESKLPDFDLLTAGFPCQSFSNAGSKRPDDPRSQLFLEIIRLLKNKPRFVLLENVQSLVRHDNGKTFTRIIEELSQLSYRVEWQIFNSKYYVPQHRERIYIFATLIDGYSGNTTRSTIFPIRPESAKSVPKDERQPDYLKISKKGRLRTRQHLASALAGGAHSGGNHSDMDLLAYPTQIRRLTLRECERLQGFDDDFTEGLGISNSQRFKALGNAVTVPVVTAIMNKLHEVIIDEEEQAYFENFNIVVEQDQSIKAV